MKSDDAELIRRVQSSCDALIAEIQRLRSNPFTRLFVRSSKFRELQKLKLDAEKLTSQSPPLKSYARWLKVGFLLVEYAEELQKGLAGRLCFKHTVLNECARHLNEARLQYDELKKQKPKVYKLQGLHSRLHQVYNMPDVLVDESRPPTINVLVPAFEFGSMSAGFFGVFQVALFIKQCGFHVRLVMYDRFEFDEKHVREKLKHYPGMESLLEDLEFAYIGDRDEPLRVSIRDSCVATFWYSAYFARKIMSVCGQRKFLYLIQDYETAFYPASTLFTLTEATYSFKYAALFSSKALQDHFLSSRIGVFATNGTEQVYINNACSSVLPRENEFITARAGDRPRRLAFYSRPPVHRNMFELGALALCEAWRQNVFEQGKWEFFGIGLGQAVVELAPGVHMHQMPRMNLVEYQKVISTFDVGFCLMASPHPSLLPFDLSVSGAVVVTNSFGVKDQAYFDTLAKGIIVSEPDLPALVDALRLAVSRSSNLEGRFSNAKAMSFPRSWEETFQPHHFEFIRKVFADCRTSPEASSPMA